MSGPGRSALDLAVALGLGLALALAASAPLSAQNDPRLVAALRLAQEGSGDSARALVQRILDATDRADTLYPEALYTRALIAKDPQDMRRDLQRVTVEYPLSSWADDALLRLAQLDFAAGNLQASARSLERLRLDYPSSPVYAEAAFWAGRAYFDLHNPAAACRWLSEGLARTGTDVELRNRLAYYEQRCAVLLADTGRADTARADSGRADTAAGRRAGAQAAGAAGGGPPAPGRAPGGARGTAPGGTADSISIDASDTQPQPRTGTPSRPRRPAPTAAAPAPAPTPRAPGGPRPAPAAPAAARYRIQIAAVNTRASADSIARRVRAAGYETVVVSEKGLFKVRAGSYATRAEAQAALPAVRARLGGRAFVVGP